MPRNPTGWQEPEAADQSYGPRARPGVRQEFQVSSNTVGTAASGGALLDQSLVGVRVGCPSAAKRAQHAAQDELGHEQRGV